MKIFQFSISAAVLGSTFLIGATAVVASRMVVSVFADSSEPTVAFENVVAVNESGKIVPFESVPDDAPRPEDFDPSGSYSIEMEKIPAAFADIQYIDIAMREYKENNGIYTSLPILPTGTLQTKKAYTLTKLLYGSREISFETEVQSGISYQFVGHFPIAKDYVECEGCDYPADLTGRLKKLKNGKVIAELDAKFYVDGC